MRKYLLSVLALFGGLSLAIFILLVPQLVSDTTVVTSYLSSVVFHNNFHEVVRGRLYRSGQMSRDELVQVVLNNHIHTVVDLRLDDDGQDRTGRTEEEAAQEGGAKYTHVPLSSSRIPPRETIEQLLDIYDHAETPILIHCSSGTHRTGVAAALWLIEKEGQSPEVAERQLSSKFGFFSLERKLKSFVQGHPTLDNLIWTYVADYKQSGIGLREWLETKFPARKET